jgi:hypothetical protein
MAGNLVQGLKSFFEFGTRNGIKVKNAVMTGAIDPIVDSGKALRASRPNTAADIAGGGPTAVKSTIRDARDHMKGARAERKAVGERNTLAGLKKGDEGFEKGPGYFDGLPDAALERAGSAADYFMGTDLLEKGYGNWSYAGGALRAGVAYGAADFLNPFSPGWND